MLLHRPTRDAAYRAKAHVESQERTVIDVSLIADEADRRVFAVFFQTALRQRPAPYKLIAVDKESNDVTELDDLLESRYRLRNYK
jgi:hypothetical protein